MVLSLLEMVVYGIVGYGTLMLVVSLIVKKEFPESPVQAAFRAAMSLPGLACLGFLAFLAVGHTDTTANEQFFFAMVADDLGTTRLEPYNEAYVPIMRENYAGTSRDFVDGVFLDNANGTHLSYFKFQDTQITDVRAWIIMHLLFMGTMFAWIIYQFAVMFQMIFARKPA